MILTVEKWHESKTTEHPDGGLYAVFAGDIYNDLIAWCFPPDTTGLSLADIIDYMLIPKFGRVCIVNYDTENLHKMTLIWHLTNHYKFAGLAASMGFEYNPIENYDRTETEGTTRTPNLSTTETRNTLTTDGGTTTTAGTGSDTQTATATGKVAPFDSATFANAQQSDTTAGTTSTDSTTVTHGKTESNTGTITTAETGTDSTTRNARTHGNIGVTTTQQMIEQERNVVNFELLEQYFTAWVNAISCNVWA